MITAGDMAALHAAAFDTQRPWSAEEFATLLARKTCFAVGDARAFALIRVITDEAELLTIATHPDHRRRGLAAECMARWQARAGGLGAVRGFLEVAADNAAAIALYRASGFETVARRRGYYRREGDDRVDAIVMACQLIAG